MVATDQQRIKESRLRIMAAKVVAQGRWPYLSTVLFSLRLVPSTSLPTLAVDNGWRMYFNPEFVLEHQAEVLATMVLHEALHCVNKHGSRFEALNQSPTLHTIWNLAGDANINKALDETMMPWGSFEPVRYKALQTYGVADGASTETAFFTMKKYFEDHPQQNQQFSDCGSVSGGIPRPYEIPTADPNNPSVKEDHKEVIRDQVAQEILKAARDRGPGSIPGELLRWAQELLRPQVNWKVALAGAIRAALANVSGRKDYVYTRPSRRQGALESHEMQVVLPAMRKPAPPAIAIVIDTSGSITNSEISEFLAEVEGIVKANGIGEGLTLIPCDVEVGEIRRIRSAAEIKHFDFHGGGGTDLRVGISAALTIRPFPRIIIVLTDGYTPWPEDRPAKVDSVIICCSVEENEKSAPGFAKFIFKNPA